jgi:mono/diheme cytochrome c family protein
VKTATLARQAAFGGRVKASALVSLAIAGVFLAGIVVAQDAQDKTTAKWVAPADAAAKKNPVAGNADAVAGGKKLFMRHCAQCHNEDGSGLQDAANLQVPEVQKQSDGSIFWKITNGNVKAGMPPFARLSDTERWQIVSFVRTLKPESADSGK